MEWIDAKTIVANNKRINRDYLAAEYTMNIYRGCSHGCIYCFASTFTSNSRILKNEEKEMAIYTSTALRKYHLIKYSLFTPSLRCRQSTMPPHRLPPPPCANVNIKHFIKQYLRNAVLAEGW